MMSITAKQLAKMLGLSPAAVSIALNNRPGVSDNTRQMVLAAAKANGYKSGNPRVKETKQRMISFVLYKKTNGTIIDDTPFFASLTEGIALCSREHGFSLDIRYFLSEQDINAEIKDLISSGTVGVILLGTEMTANDFAMFENIQLPLVILDTYFESISRDYVLINNTQGAFLATDTLIKSRKRQPGYLHSSYLIGNFEERKNGFFKALLSNGMTPEDSIVHTLSPCVDGAYRDMNKLLDEDVHVADCYFADNDLIAAGAMRAFKEHGYRIPEDVAFVGFDNAFPVGIISPPLTTINVPKQTMGRMAVERLTEIISGKSTVPLKTELMTSLVKRSSL